MRLLERMMFDMFFFSDELIMSKDKCHDSLCIDSLCVCPENIWRTLEDVKSNFGQLLFSIPC